MERGWGRGLEGASTLLPVPLSSCTPKAFGVGGVGRGEVALPLAPTGGFVPDIIHEF
jgi:hypothetical protein